MIVHEKFVIAHIGKTGGDAAKQYTAALNLPGVTFHSVIDPQKHLAPWKLLDLTDKDLILTIRRLPAREVSWFHHKRALQKPKIEVDLPKFLIHQHNGENEIRYMTQEGQHEVKHYIRSESLLDDLLQVYRLYFEITPEQEARARAAPTKKRLPYDHKRQWLTQEEIDRLYEVSPTWSQHELKAYGGLLCTAQ